MKYDLRASLRLFIPIWIGTVLLSVINAIAIYSSLEWEHWALELLTTLTMIANIVLLASMFIVTLIYIVIRFYHALVKDEAYLTFTLPVRVDSILWAKIFSGMVLYVGAFLVFMISIVVLVSGALTFDDLPYIWPELMKYLNVGEVFLTVVLALILLLVGLIASLLQMYVSVAIGQLAQKQKVIASVGAYIGINIAISSITSMISTPALIHGALNWDQMVFSPMRTIHVIWLGMAVVMLMNAAIGAVFYFITRHMFSRKLNLE